MKGFGEKNQSKKIKTTKNEELVNIDQLMKKGIQTTSTRKETRSIKILCLSY